MIHDDFYDTSNDYLFATENQEIEDSPSVILDEQVFTLNLRW